MFKSAPRPSISDLFDSRRSAPAPWERVHFQPEGDDPTGGGTPPPTPPPAKTYTDAELNAFLAKERKSAEDKTAKAIEAAKAEAAAELEKLRDELATAGKSAEEKARIQAEQAAKRIQAEQERQARELTEYKTQLEAERAAHKTTRLSHLATSALTEAKAFPSALADAIPSFLSSVEIDFGEKGEITGVRYGGVAQKSLKDAATAYLKDRPYFAAAPTGGGAGTRSPNGGPPAGKSLADLSPTELMALGLSKPARGTHAIAAPGDDTPAD